MNIQQTKTDALKKAAMLGAAGKKTPNGITYTQAVKTLSQRLRCSPKKIRRQARTQHWA